MDIIEFIEKDGRYSEKEKNDIAIFLNHHNNCQQCIRAAQFAGVEQRPKSTTHDAKRLNYGKQKVAVAKFAGKTNVKGR